MGSLAILSTLRTFSNHRPGTDPLERPGATDITAHVDFTAVAEAALALAMASGQAYWNIHTSSFAGVEIRGFLVAVPEPSGLALLGIGGIVMAAGAWSKRRVMERT